MTAQQLVGAMHLDSRKSGFMEPTGHGVYHENRYPKTPWDEEDHLEERTYDLCETSSEDGGEEAQEEQVHKISQRISSYGSIKKRKYRQPTYKIAPNRNAKHSITVTKQVAFAEQEIPDDPNEQPQTLPPNTFVHEKVQQQALSPSERFENARKKRTEIRLKRRAACEKARKVKDRSLRDAKLAQACLVDSVPTSSLQVVIERSEYSKIGEFVDLSSRDSVRGRARPQQ